MLEHVKEVEGHGKGHDRTHVLTELAACATEMSGEMRDISHASAVIATFSSMLVYKLTNLQKNSIPLHASFVINAHILQTALYRVNFNLATVLVSPYFRGLADATQLMATWSQKATWDARRKKGEVGMVAPGNSARGTVAKLMALRNFPHADANGDGMLSPAMVLIRDVLPAPDFPKMAVMLAGSAVNAAERAAIARVATMMRSNLVESEHVDVAVALDRTARAWSSPRSRSHAPSTAVHESPQSDSRSSNDSVDSLHGSRPARRGRS